MTRQAGAVLGMLFLANAAAAQFTQQGSKLVGTGAVDAAQQGTSVAISADGTTAIVGGRLDTGFRGAAWVYTRSGGVWSQQGSKLVGTGAVGTAQLGWSVAISADGNTAIIGGPFDNPDLGAAWVFTRSGGVWSQQGSKLVGTGAVGAAQQGYSVAISGDGNTAIVGGYQDNSNAGAAWVFTRSGGVWSQQGSKLVGTGASGPAYQGSSVAISADGTTAIVGGYNDNSNPGGAAWVFTRSGGVWLQQGAKLVGTDRYQVSHSIHCVVACPGSANRREEQRARELVMLVGVERCGLRVKDLAVVIGSGAGSASRLYAEAAAVRRSDSGFAAIAEQATHALRKSEKKSSRRQSIK